MATLLEMVLETTQREMLRETSAERLNFERYLSEATSFSPEEYEVVTETIKTFMKKDYEETKADFKRLKAAVKDDWKKSFRLAKGDKDKIAKAKAVYRKKMNALDKRFKAKLKAIWKTGNAHHRVAFDKSKAYF